MSFECTLFFSDGLVRNRTDELRAAEKAGTHRLAVYEVPPLCGWMQNNKKCLMLGFRWAVGPSVPPPAGSERRIPFLLISLPRPTTLAPPSPSPNRPSAPLPWSLSNGVIVVADVRHLS